MVSLGAGGDGGAKPEVAKLLLANAAAAALLGVLPWLKMVQLCWKTLAYSEAILGSSNTSTWFAFT